MVNYLIIRPLFDEPTRWTDYCAQEIVDFLKEKRESFIDLREEEAVREEVEKVIKKEVPVVVLFYNHGDWDKWIGNDHRAVIDLTNCDLLSRKASYTLACLTAIGLGTEVWRKKGVAYVGYIDVVYLHVDKELIDKYYKKPFNAGFYAIYEKKKWKEVKQAMIEAYDESIAKATRDGRTIVASLLEHNRDALRVYDHDKPCLARRIARRLLGKVAYRLRRVFGWIVLIFGFGIGVMIHDFFLQCPDPLRIPPHGFWWGLLCVIIAFILARSEWFLR